MLSSKVQLHIYEKNTKDFDHVHVQTVQKYKKVPLFSESQVKSQNGRSYRNIFDLCAHRWSIVLPNGEERGGELN